MIGVPFYHKFSHSGAPEAQLSIARGLCRPRIGHRRRSLSTRYLVFPTNRPARCTGGGYPASWRQPELAYSADVDVGAGPRWYVCETAVRDEHRRARRVPIPVAAHLLRRRRRQSVHITRWGPSFPILHASEATYWPVTLIQTDSISNTDADGQVGSLCGGCQRNYLIGEDGGCKRCADQDAKGMIWIFFGAHVFAMYLRLRRTHSAAISTAVQQALHDLADSHDTAGQPLFDVRDIAEVATTISTLKSEADKARFKWKNEIWKVTRADFDAYKELDEDADEDYTSAEDRVDGEDSSGQKGISEEQVKSISQKIALCRHSVTLCMQNTGSRPIDTVCPVQTTQVCPAIAEHYARPHAP
eukprot:SAG11_NODE_4038_length_2094_cov_2.142356_2_plen_358_part_00